MKHDANKLPLLLPLRTSALLLLPLMLTACATRSVVLQRPPQPISELLKSEQTASDAYLASAQDWSKKASDWLQRARSESERLLTK